MTKRIRAAIMAMFFGIASVLAGCSETQDKNAINNEEDKNEGHVHGSSFFSGVMAGHLLGNFLRNNNNSSDFFPTKSNAVSAEPSPSAAQKTAPAATVKEASAASTKATGGFGSAGARSAVS